MPPSPASSGSSRPSAVWNEAIREFLRSRYGRSLSSAERVEYQRLRDGYTAAMRAEVDRAA